MNAEHVILGDILLDPSQFQDVAGIVSAQDFRSTFARRVWETFLDLEELSEPIDIVTVTNHLRQAGRLEAKDASQVAELLDLGMPLKAIAHARIVHEDATRRRLEAGVAEVLERVRTGACSNEEAVGDLERVTQGCSVQTQDRTVTAAEAASWLIEDLRAHHKRGEIRAFVTGVPALDKYAWIKHTDFDVIGARPGTGKTHLANWISRSSAELGEKPLVFSLEMSAADNLQRTSRGFGDFSPDVFRDPRDPEELEAAIRAVRQAGRLPILYSRENDAESVLRTMRQKVQSHGVSIVIIDYLQRLRFPSEWGRNRDVQIGEATRRLKQFALDWRVPVFCLAQLRRPDPKLESKPPTTAELRESGNIEADADNILLLHKVKHAKPKVEGYAKLGKKPPNTVQWIFAKCRDKADHMSLDFELDNRGIFIPSRNEEADHEI